MGVFEFVIVIVFFSFVFKIIKLHYESQGNNSSRGTAGGSPNAQAKSADLGGSRSSNAAKKFQQPASTKSWPANLIWLFLFPVACSLAGFLTFYLSLGSIQAVVSDTYLLQSPEMQKPHEPPAAVTSEKVPVAPSSIQDAAKQQANLLTGSRREAAPDDFLADYYPSIVDCAAPLAIKIYHEISDKLPSETSPEAEGATAEGDEGKPNEVAGEAMIEPTEFYITNGGLSDQDYLPFVVAFRKKIESNIKNSSVRDVSGQITDYLKPPESLYRVNVSRIRKEINGETDYSAGRVICKVKGKVASTEVITNYVQKLWLTDFQAFEAKNPDKQYVVGRCDEFFPQQTQARERALKNVFNAPIATNAGTKHKVRDFSYRHADSFLQKYERSYGDVFRCAVLLELDLDHPAMAESATSINSASESSFLASAFDCGWKPSFEWSVALLIGLTVVIGTISNVLTQGYYRTEISRTVMLGMVSGFLILVSIVAMTLIDSAH